MILVGAVLTQLGLIVATPALVGGAARLGRFLPLAPRLALRDAARHRGRSAAPLVAAVRRIAPPTDVFDVRSFDNNASCATTCRYVAVVAPPQNRCPAGHLEPTALR